MTDQERAVMQQALEALERLQNAIYNIGGEHVTGLYVANDAADSAEKPMGALRAALAQQQPEPVQEPVAGAVLNADGRPVLVRNGMEDWYCKERNARRLYAAPPQQPEPAQEQLAMALNSAEFHRRRCESLQSWQSKMRDPERTIVCDILANGKTLHPSFAGDRYTTPPQRKPVAWDGRCMLGHCNSPAGCENSGECRAVERKVRGNRND